ncbi:TolC family protein [Fusobacterium perfoetens]|uniref:TolC family protein n=1 Tax=Fusobacterium perfoetens TaxID=852 RepID=UPI001F378163|nr:TolC family protein [Fusobacterium perfoetens]MCF2625572.1 TolC family protein [Fusobacterium perfoetens]
MKKVLGILFLMSTAAFARNLTLDEAIELSLNNSKKIQISSKNMKIGELNLARAFKTALPSVAYEGSYSRFEHTKRDMYGRETGVNKISNISDSGKYKNNAHEGKGGYSSQIVISQPIFQGGAILGGIKGAKAQSNIMDLSYIAEKRDVRLDTIQMYSNIIRYQKDLEALETSKKELEIRHKEQKNKLDLKLIIKADLLKTEVSMLEVESNIVQVKNLIEVEMKKLKIETGLLDEELTLTDFSVPEGLSEGIDFDKDMVTAKTSSLDALIAKNNVEYAKAEKMVAFSDNLPKVNAFVQYGGYERDSMDDTFHNEEWRGGVSVSWEMFNFGSGIDSYRAANESYKIEKLNDSIAQDNIEINLTTAYSEVIRLEKLRIAMRSSLEASQENYAIDTERYKAGLLSTQDYLNSEAQLRQSKVDYNKAETDYLVAFERYRSLLI